MTVIYQGHEIADPEAWCVGWPTKPEEVEEWFEKNDTELEGALAEMANDES